MSGLQAIWQRLPVIVKAVFTGLVVAAVGTTPWALLVNLNVSYASSIPWAVPVTAFYLWLYWRYLQGAWGSRSTAERRKKNCRATKLSDETWGVALVAGMAGLTFIVSFQAVFSRMVNMPTQSTATVSHLPVVTQLFFVLMSAIVAGVAEEAGFRGYMQKPIEERHGPLVAMLVVGLAFGFAHFTHPGVSLPLMPYYLTVATIYGMLAYLTNSILPGMVLHAGGNLLGTLGLLMKSDPHGAARPPLLIWETGLDSGFLISCGLAFLTGVITALACRQLASTARKNHHRTHSDELFTQR